MALFQAAVLALAGLVGVQPAPAQHPLDPLSAEEIRTAARAMRADPRLGGAAFPLLTLAEPAKAEVLAWGAGNALARRARVLAATAPAGLAGAASCGGCDSGSLGLEGGGPVLRLRRPGPGAQFAEGLGERDKARRSYQFVVDAWHRPDSELLR